MFNALSVLLWKSALIN